jgi:hypothetical protein
VESEVIKQKSINLTALDSKLESRLNDTIKMITKVKLVPQNPPKLNDSNNPCAQKLTCLTQLEKQCDNFSMKSDCSFVCD